MKTELILGKTPGGKFISFLSDEHVIGQGRSGSGKTASIAIPASFNFAGSLVALDIKGELFAATAGWRAAQDSAVFLFNPGARDGRSHRWNPFFAVNRDSPDRFDQVSQMANQLFPEILGPSEESANFWNGAARDAFTSAALMVAETPELPLTMAEVLRVFRRPSPGDWMVGRVEERRRIGQPFSQAVVEGVEAFRAKEGDRLGNSIVVTVTTALQIWQNPRVVAATSETDFDIRDLRRRKMSIYLAVAPSAVARYAPLLRLFFDAVLAYNTDRTPRQDPALSVPTLILLDEFARLGRMPRVAESLQYVRAYGLRYCLLVQNRPQVMATYGSDAATDIWDNVGAEVIFSTSDHVLARQISERMGDDTVNVVTRHRPRFFAALNPGKQSAAEHPHRRPVMLPAEIMQLPQQQVIILRPGMPGALAQKIRWWQELEFAGRQLSPPEIPELQVVVDLDDGAPLAQPRRKITND